MAAISFAKTVQGATHVRQGIPCEDASGCYADLAGRYHIAVIADGHGDPTCARSARGSRIAVEQTIAILRAFAESRLEQGAHARAEERVQTDAILSRWSHAVIEDYESDPMGDDGWAKLGLQGFSTLTGIRRSHAIEHLYGSTLVAMLVLPDRIVALQQGDGLAVMLLADGSLIRPVPEDPLCVGNVTTSLSDLNARAEFRARQVVIPRGVKGGVVACFVSSDGIDKSLPNVAATKNYFRDIALDALDGHTQVELEQHLGIWFDNLSSFGIGDDVSCAGFVDLTLGASAFDTIVRQRDASQREIDLAVARSKIQSMERKAQYLSQRPELEESQEFLAEYERLKAIVSELVDDRSQSPTGGLDPSDSDDSSAHPLSQEDAISTEPDASASASVEASGLSDSVDVDCLQADDEAHILPSEDGVQQARGEGEADADEPFERLSEPLALHGGAPDAFVPSNPQDGPRDDSPTEEEAGAQEENTVEIPLVDPAASFQMLASSRPAGVSDEPSADVVHTVAEKAGSAEHEAHASPAQDARAREHEERLQTPLSTEPVYAQQVTAPEGGAREARSGDGQSPSQAVSEEASPQRVIAPKSVSFKTDRKPAMRVKPEPKPISPAFLILLAVIVFAIAFASVMIFLSWRAATL